MIYLFKILRGITGNFKAQSAIEYLMTYGWMLLVVAIVGGAIFSVVGDQSIQSVNGFSNNDLSVENFGLNDFGLSIVLRGQGSDEISLKGLNLSSESGSASIVFDEAKNFELGENQELKLAEVQRSEENQNIDISLRYSLGNLQNLTTSGSVTGNFVLEENLIWKDNFCTDTEEQYVKKEYRDNGESNNEGWIIEKEDCKVRTDTSNSVLTMHTNKLRKDIDGVNITVEYLGTDDDDAVGPVIYDSESGRWWAGSITNDAYCNGISYIEDYEPTCVSPGNTKDVKKEHKFNLIYSEGTLKYYVDGEKNSEHNVDISPDGFGLISGANSPPAYYDSITVREIE